MIQEGVEFLGAHDYKHLQIEYIRLNRACQHKLQITRIMDADKVKGASGALETNHQGAMAAPSRIRVRSDLFSENRNQMPMWSST